MSYGSSAALQEAVFGALSSDIAVSSLTNGAVYDAEPVGVLPPMYISLGPEQVRSKADKTGGGALHEFIVSVVSEAPGFSSAKSVAVAVGDRLVDAELALARGELVSLRFHKAKAVRIENGAKRRIDLTFRARVSD
jgi:hypothetical protein